jgi:hypothetical protein
LEIGNNWRLSGVNMTEVLYFSNGVSQVDKNMPLYLITDVNAKDFKTFPFEGVLGLSPNVPDNNYTSLGKAIPLQLITRSSASTCSRIHKSSHCSP